MWGFFGKSWTSPQLIVSRDSISSVSLCLGIGKNRLRLNSELDILWKVRQYFRENRVLFRDEYRFKKSWRAYQKRVLDQLDDYLKDGHVHIVAAPGSGKTVLGLEVVRRLNLPTIVFAPTKSIREQWSHRLRQDFLPDNADTTWVSNDLRDPGFLTISTYQSLSSIFRKKDEVKTLIKSLKQRKVRVIVVDEAHHLRANWWKCLEEIKSNLENPLIIALTATPPIDVAQAEWNRYSSFCGIVDIEVNVPELVQSGTLCPHQDFIYLNQPTCDEMEVLDAFRVRVDQVLLDMQIDTALAQALAHSDNQWISPGDGKGHFRRYQMFYLALTTYLRNTVALLPAEVAEKYQLRSEELPTALPIEMAEAMLQGLCVDFQDRMSTDALGRFKPYRERLSQIGAIEKRLVHIQGTSQLETILKSSPAKLHSITEIIDHELSSQGRDLRAVILADYIRKEALTESSVADGALSKIGVAPIFELLRQMRLDGLSMAMLTGSITIIPQEKVSALEKLCTTFRLTEVSFCELPHDPHFCYVEARSGEQDRLTLLLTHLFELGELNCLVGTAALLGEGWDAPSVNTLVLATYVGSFVMSNQMRGRAIRRNPNDPEKVANIWHLATVAPGQSKDAFAQKDFIKLKRRFENFHGVRKDGDQSLVESGMGRMDLTDFQKPEAYNQRMLRLAEERYDTAVLWKNAFSEIPEGRFLRPIKEIIIPHVLVTSRFILMMTGDSPDGVRHRVGMYLRERRMRRVAQALLQSLQASEVISASVLDSQVEVKAQAQRILVSLPSAPSKDQALFSEVLDQCYDALYMPDYFLSKGTEYLMIPKVISKHAKDLHRALKKAGYRKYTLHSSASTKGQQELLKIRNSFLMNADKQCEIVSKVRWQV